MKKILIAFIMLLSLTLVACDTKHTGDTALISNVEISSKRFEADLTILASYKSELEMYELIHSAINLVYDDYKDDFGTQTYTLYFTVYKKGESEALGVITYKVNDSNDNPGLTYIGNNLS
ncbi:hypothetical protein [Acholeplasma granularum]|uniref:hypothetical protein n=1 Tax=Acholeplasma granularum TaxID=264635 RepID=UPI00046ED014|nr:hypothetical protein [Acholeplasma granularum]